MKKETKKIKIPFFAEVRKHNKHRQKDGTSIDIKIEDEKWREYAKLVTNRLKVNIRWNSAMIVTKILKDWKEYNY